MVRLSDQQRQLVLRWRGYAWGIYNKRWRHIPGAADHVEAALVSIVATYEPRDPDDPNAGFASYLRCLLWNRMLDERRRDGTAKRGEQEPREIPAGIFVDRDGQRDEIGRRLVVTDRYPSDDDNIEMDERFTRILRALPSQERAIVWAHDVHGETLASIGRRYGFSESRASQLRTAGLHRLRRRLGVA